MATLIFRHAWKWVLSFFYHPHAENRITTSSLLKEKLQGVFCHHRIQNEISVLLSSRLASYLEWMMALSFSFSVNTSEDLFHRQSGDDRKSIGLDSYKVYLIEELEGAKSKSQTCFHCDLMRWFPSEKQRTDVRAGSSCCFAAELKL